MELQKEYSKNKLTVDYNFTDKEKEFLESKFLALKANPYENYVEFRNEMVELVNNKKDQKLQDIVTKIQDIANREWKEEPYLYLQNCPIDKNVPIFDFENPVISKRENKKTFVSEAFLQFYAFITGIPAIGYINVNDGDIFQDIYPMKKLANSQSQKATASLGFHKDLANHFVRPDFVNMLSMRSTEENEIYTTFVKNTDLMKNLSKNDIQIMKQETFYTPFDDLSTHDNKHELGRAKNHSILLNEDEYDIAYFENRTIGLDEESQKVVDKIKKILHDLKAPHLLKPGEFISLSNNHSIHGKDVGEINNPEAQKIRWIIKTVNVWDLNKHKEFMQTNSDCVVEG